MFKVGVHGDYDYNDERNDFDYYYGTVFYNLILYPNNDSEYDIESKDRYNGMFVHDFKDKDSTLSFFSGTGVDFNGYSSLSDAITTIVERFENKEEYTKAIDTMILLFGATAALSVIIGNWGAGGARMLATATAMVAMAAAMNLFALAGLAMSRVDWEDLGKMCLEPLWMMAKALDIEEPPELF